MLLAFGGQGAPGQPYFYPGEHQRLSFDLINGRKTASEFDGLVDIISISLNASTPEKYQELCLSIRPGRSAPLFFPLPGRSRLCSSKWCFP